MKIKTNLRQEYLIGKKDMFTVADGVCGVARTIDER